MNKTNWMVAGAIVAALILGLAIGWFGWLAAVIFVGLIAAAALIKRPVTLLYLLLGLVVIGQFGRIPPGSASGAFLLTDAVAGLLCGIWLIYYLSRPASKTKNEENKLRVTPEQLAWGGFLGIALIALVFNPLFIAKKEIALNGFYLFRLVAYTSLAWIIPSLLPKPAQRTTLMRVLFWVLLAVALLGFVQLYILPDIGRLAAYGWDPHVGRLVSSFLDPNFLGGFLALGIAFMALGVSAAKKPWQVWGSWSAIIVMVLASVLTYSRSGYLAVGIVILILGLRYSWKLLLIACLIAVPLALTIPRIQERVAGGFSVDQTAQDRINSWDDAATIINHYPLFGVGYNNYRDAQEKLGLLDYGSTTKSGSGSDSSLLTVLATTGYIGIGLFMLALVLVLKRAWKTMRQAGRRPTPGTITALTLLIAAPAIFVHSWFVNGLFYPFILIVLATLIGVLYAHPQE